MYEIILSCIYMKEFKSKFTKLTQILIEMPLFNKDSSSYKSLSRAQFKELLSRTVHLWKSTSMVSKGYIQCTCRINLWNRKYWFTLIESLLKLAIQTVTEHRNTSTDRRSKFLNVYMTVQHCSFGKKVISCINLASQTSKLETWDSIFTSRNSKGLCFATQGLSVKLLLRYFIFIFQSFKVCECYTWWFLILVIQLYLCLSIFVICFVLILRWLAKGSFNTIHGYH